MLVTEQFMKHTGLRSSDKNENFSRLGKALILAKSVKSQGIWFSGL